MNYFNTLSVYFRHRLGTRAQKIPLDAGSGCPNRDGTISKGGCTFCNPVGSGSGMGLAGRTLEEQWAIWRARYARSRRAESYIAYLQSFSNTYGSPLRLKNMLDEIQALEGVVGVSVGTRPDCLDEEKLDILAGSPLREVWLELGVQTSHDASLERVNRGHGVAASEWAIGAAAERGLRVCAHLIFGLPGETRADMLRTVDWINTLPVLGVKFHCLYVCRGTALAHEWERGRYAPMLREEYVSLLVEVLSRLRSDIVVHRLVGEPAADELLAPSWAADKRSVGNDIINALAAQGLWQGCRNDAPERPLWFDNPLDLPKAGLAAHAAALAALRAVNSFYRCSEDA